MKLTLRFAFLVYAALLSPALLHAYDGPMRFSIFEPCKGNSQHCALQILAEGKIEPNTGDKFAAFLLKSRGAVERGNAFIAFNSKGGSLSGAIKLGELIRKNGFDTLLSASYLKVVWNSTDEKVFVRNAVCASSCALAFVGGVTRHIAADDIFGVHRFRGDKGSVGDEHTQLAVLIVASYLEKMGIDGGLLDLASLAPLDKMIWLSQEQAQQLRVDNTIPPFTPWQIDATKDGNPMLTSSQEISPGRRLHAAFLTNRGQPLLVAAVSLSTTRFSSARINMFPDNESPTIQLVVDGKEINTESIGKWEIIKSDGFVQFRAYTMLTPEALKAIGNANQLSISDGFPKAYVDLSLATNLSTQNLANGVALLIRFATLKQ